MGRLKSKLVLVIVIAIVALGAGVVTGPVLLSALPLVDKAGGFASAEANPPQAASAREPAPEPGLMYPMQERVISIGESAGLHYVKIGIVLEFDVPDARGLKGEAYKKRQDEFIKEMANRLPIMEDIVTSVLGTKTPASLSSEDGRESLRDEIKTRIGGVTGERKLLNVYFTQFIIQ